MPAGQANLQMMSGRGWFFFGGLILGPLIAVIIVGIGFWSWRATSVPPSWETILATRSLHAAVAREAKNLKAPISASEETLRAGMKIYRSNCAGCHGDFGQPSKWGRKRILSACPAIPPSANGIAKRRDVFDRTGRDPLFRNGVMEGPDVGGRDVESCAVSEQHAVIAPGS